MKEAPDLLQLTLDLAVITFKSFRRIVGFVEFVFEYGLSKMNPWTEDKEELVTGLINKGIVSELISCLRLIRIRSRGRRAAANPWTFRPMRSIIFIGDIPELATEGFQFCFNLVLPEFIFAYKLEMWPYENNNA
jgi:hypothetical protein